MFREVMQYWLQSLKLQAGQSFGANLVAYQLFQDKTVIQKQTWKNIKTMFVNIMQFCEKFFILPAIFFLNARKDLCKLLVFSRVCSEDT